MEAAVEAAARGGGEVADALVDDLVRALQGSAGGVWPHRRFHLACGCVALLLARPSWQEAQAGELPTDVADALRWAAAEARGERAAAGRARREG